MKSIKPALLTLLFLAYPVVVPVLAGAQGTTRCVTSPLMVGKTMAGAIAAHVTRTLTQRGWTGVVVQIKGLKLPKKNTAEGTDLVETYDWADTIDLSERTDSPRGISLEGRFGERLAERGELDCYLPLAQRIRAVVSGSYIGSDGKSVAVKKAALDLSGLEVPGRQLLSDQK